MQSTISDLTWLFLVYSYTLIYFSPAFNIVIQDIGGSIDDFIDLVHIIGMHFLKSSFKEWLFKYIWISQLCVLSCCIYVWDFKNLSLKWLWVGNVADWGIMESKSWWNTIWKTFDRDGLQSLLVQTKHFSSNCKNTSVLWKAHMLFQKLCQFSVKEKIISYHFWSKQNRYLCLYTNK